MNRGEELEDERAAQDHHLAPRSTWPTGEVVPHLAAACAVKGEDTLSTNGHREHTLPPPSLRGSPVEWRSCLSRLQRSSSDGKEKRVLSP